MHTTQSINEQEDTYFRYDQMNVYTIEIHASVENLFALLLFFAPLTSNINIIYCLLTTIICIIHHIYFTVVKNGNKIEL